MSEQETSTTATTESQEGQDTVLTAPAPEVEAQATAPEAEGQKPEEQAQGAPEKYEFEMPEGVDLDQNAADEFSAVAKELGLTQEQAAKVAEVGANMALRQQEAHAKQVAEWATAVQKDPEIGGVKLQESTVIARKALAAFGSPELVEMLNVTGLGNHPALVKAFYKAGLTISDDKFVAGGHAAPVKSAAEALYPTMHP